MKNQLPPTDTRLRPDQRLVENGDFTGAAIEKDRLEKRQRAVRGIREKNKLGHVPYYFDCIPNEDDDNKMFYKYNGKYFEQDRKNLDYQRLMPIYDDDTPDEQHVRKFSIIKQ